MSTTGRVWFVTGAGRGLGRAFAVAALEAGDRVVGTVRRTGVLDDLAAQHPGALDVVVLDVRERADVVDVVDSAVERHGRLDVVVNNAGYGIVGAVEELSENEVREHLDTNLLGAWWVTAAALPHLRRQGSGHVVQVSSTGGVGAMPTLGLYNAGKWALEAFTEALAAEVGDQGVRVTIAELGGFDTDWAGSSMRFATPLPAYDGLRTDLFGTPEVPWPRPDPEQPTEPAGADPRAAAAAVLAHVQAPDGPLRLLVGHDAPGQVEAALAARRDDYGRDPRFTWPASGGG